MKSFKISKTKLLSELNEDVITLKSIASTELNNLIGLTINVITKFPDNSTKSSYINTFDPHSRDSQIPQIKIDYKIVDCKYSTMEVESPKEKEFEIFYETLEDKLNHLKEKEDKTRSNIENEIDKWQKSVNSLYANIIEWIQPYGDNIKIQSGNINIQEDQTGRYEIALLKIKPFSSKEIMFTPIGTFILGAEGRIDIFISGFGKDLMLILNRTNSIDTWNLIINKNIQSRRVFNKSQLINLIDEVISL